MRDRGLNWVVVSLLLIAAMCYLAAYGCTGGETDRPPPTTETTVCYPMWDACLATPQTIERSD